MKCDNEQYIYFHTSTTSLSSYPVWLSINRPQIMSLGVRQATVTKFCWIERWRGQHSSSCFVSSLRYHFSIVDHPCVRVPLKVSHQLLAVAASSAEDLSSNYHRRCFVGARDHLSVVHYSCASASLEPAHLVVLNSGRAQPVNHPCIVTSV